jgi:hypothetical protein
MKVEKKSGIRISEGLLYNINDCCSVNSRGKKNGCLISVYNVSFFFSATVFSQLLFPVTKTWNVLKQIFCKTFPVSNIIIGFCTPVSVLMQDLPRPAHTPNLQAAPTTFTQLSGQMGLTI